MAVYENYEFASGEDYNGLEIDWSAFGQGVGLGAEGGAGVGASPNNGGPQENPQGDVMIGLDSDGSGFFNDGSHETDAGGFDAMRGLADDRHVEVLRDAELYTEQEPVPFEFPLPSTAEPGLA